MAYFCPLTKVKWKNNDGVRMCGARYLSDRSPDSQSRETGLVSPLLSFKNMSSFALSFGSLHNDPVRSDVEISTVVGNMCGTILYCRVCFLEKSS